MEGTFQLEGMEFTYQVESAENEVGDEIDLSDLDDEITHTDRIVYSITDSVGESHYRTIYGPYSSIDDLVSGIIDAWDETIPRGA